MYYVAMCLFFVFFAVFPAHAQTWGSFSGEENSIKAIVETVETSGPVLWVGTHYGLARWTIYRGNLVSPVKYMEEDGKGEGLVNNRINCIKKTEKNGSTWLWIGTEGGVSFFNSNGTRSPIDDTWQEYYTGRSVRSIDVASDGVVWFATDKGVLSFDGSVWSEFSTTNTAIPSDNVYSLKADKTPGKVWAGTALGVTVLDGGVWSPVTLVKQTAYSIFIEAPFVWFGTSVGVKRLKDEVEVTSHIQLKPWVSQITKDGSGDYIFVTSSGVYAMSQSSPTSFQKYAQVGKYFFEDSSGSEWLGTQRDGIVKLNGSLLNIKTNKSLISDRVNSIVRDESGELWFGTSEGLSHLSGSVWESFTTQDGLVSDVISDISIDFFGGLWIGTDRGLSQFDPTGNVWTSHLQGKTVSAVCAVTHGKKLEVWVSVLRGGLYRYDGGVWTNYVHENDTPSGGGISVVVAPNINSDSFTCINEDIRGKVWFGSYNGFVSYDSVNDRWEESVRTVGGVLDLLQVNDIESDSNGIIWLATTQGLLRYAPLSGEYKLLNPGNEGLNFLVLETTHDGRVLAGTEAGFYSHNGVNFANFLNTDSAPFPTDIVTSIAVDEKLKLWFGFGDVGGVVTVSQSFTPLLSPFGVLSLFLLFPGVFFSRSLICKKFA